MKIQVSKNHYFRPKYNDLARFISYWYQIILPQELIRAGEKILEVGKGSGVVSNYLANAGYTVATIDIDPALKPDVVADIRTLPFGDESFEVVLAYEVLEHLPFEDLNTALAELARVSRKYVVISLPYRSSGFELVAKFPLIRTIFKKSFFNLFFRVPLKFGGIKTSGQHYWEIDGVKYRLGKIRRVLGERFQIVKELRPPLNHYHYFFVLERKITDLRNRQ